MIPDIAFFDSDDVGAYEGPVFDDFINRWVWKRTRHFIRKLLRSTGQGDRGDVDEVTNEVHLAVLLKLDRASIATEPTPADRFRRFRCFVNRDAAHRALTPLRSLTRSDERNGAFVAMQLTPDDDASPSMSLLHDVAVAATFGPALRALSKEELEVLVLHIVDKYTFREMVSYYGGKYSQRALCQRFALARMRAKALLRKAAVDASSREKP